MHKINVYGTYSTANAADTATIYLKANGTTLLALVSPKGVVTREPWYGEMIVTIREEGINGNAATFGHIEIGTDVSHGNMYSAHINTTVVNGMGITTKWDTANSGNVIRIDQGILHIYT